MISFTGFMQEKSKFIPSETIEIKQPPFLKKGDTIAILAPAGILKNKEIVIEKATALAKSWGLHVILGEHIYAQNHHFAGTDAQRAKNFQKALDNPNIKAIWAARGGYGSARILDKLDFTGFKKHPKWVIGYSDITAFHSHIHKLGFASLHAVMPINFETEEDISITIKTLKNALFGNPLGYIIPASIYNKLGTASGVLVGGNLSILTSKLGSISQISIADKILFIEEIGEYKYSIDRMLQSLKRAGYFENCKGMIVGDISNIKINNPIWGASIEELILDVVKEYDFPVVFNFPAGHEPINQALVFGKKVVLISEKKSSKIIFE